MANQVTKEQVISYLELIEKSFINRPPKIYFVSMGAESMALFEKLLKEELKNIKKY